MNQINVIILGILDYSDLAKKIVTILEKGHNRSVAVDYRKPRLSDKEAKDLSFEGYYSMTLENMLKDVETRDYSRKREMRFIINNGSCINLVPFINASQKIAPEYRSYLNDMIFGHFVKFPVTKVIYMDIENFDNNGLPVNLELKRDVELAFLDMFQTSEISFHRITSDSISKQEEEIIHLIFDDSGQVY